MHYIANKTLTKVVTCIGYKWKPMYTSGVSSYKRGDYSCTHPRAEDAGRIPLGGYATVIAHLGGDYFLPT